MKSCSAAVSLGNPRWHCIDCFNRWPEDPPHKGLNGPPEWQQEHLAKNAAEHASFTRDAAMLPQDDEPAVENCWQRPDGRRLFLLRFPWGRMRIEKRLHLVPLDGTPVYEHIRQLTRRPGEGQVSTLDEVSRMEDRTNEMLYRRELEFARGHGISVDWTLAEERWDGASEVWTTALPMAVVRAVDQPNVPSLITDMKELAESSDAELAVKLQPLVDAYASWITELDERRKNEADLQACADVAVNAVTKGEEVLKRLKEGLRFWSPTPTRAPHSGSRTRRPNSVWKAGIIIPSWRQPFDVIAVANESERPVNSDDKPESGLNRNWLPGMDSNHISSRRLRAV